MPDRLPPIGLGAIDPVETEHRLQLSLLGALEELLRPGAAGPEVVQRTLAQLIDFTAVHFRSEELVMELYGYPGAAAHHDEHRRLGLELLALRAGAGEGAAHPALLEAVRRLRGLLLDHLRTVDQELAAWCARRGLSVA